MLQMLGLSELLLKKYLCQAMRYLLDAAFARHVLATASAISPFIGKGWVATCFAMHVSAAASAIFPFIGKGWVASCVARHVLTLCIRHHSPF